ncbi:MAG TPA: CarD family transcriptional regulator [Candidatus Binatia bacterium]|jgi:CarD family transcriptional regulator
MTFNIGHKVVYPSHGPCLIGAVVKKVICGKPASFYRLMSLDETGDAVLVPLDKITGQGIRQLMAKSEIPKLLGCLKHPSPNVANWKQRALANLNRLSSGSAYDLAEVIESLTELNERRPLAPRERQTLEKARRILICEISEVIGESKSAAEKQIDRALKSRKSH